MAESTLASRLRTHWLTDAADAGLRSSHGALVDMALSGPPTGGGMTGDEATARAVRGLERAREHRTMEHALASLSMLHRAALWLAYGPHTWPAEARKLFRSMGAEVGVVLLAPSALSRWRADVLAREVTNPESAYRARSFGPGEWLRLRAAQSIRGQVAKEARALLRSAESALSAALIRSGDFLETYRERTRKEGHKSRSRVQAHHDVDFLVRL